jgi:hypothetical protein
MNYFENLNIIIIHGGKNDKMKRSFFNDYFILDVELFTWTQVHISDGVNRDCVIERAEHSSVIVGDKLIILGGNNKDMFVGSDLMIASLGKIIYIII